MSRKTFSVATIVLLLLSVVMLAFNVQPARADAQAVYINADGSITPAGTPIVTSDNVTYVLTDNIGYPTYDGIVVERSNIVIDGNGYSLQGEQTRNGLNLMATNNVTINNINIEYFQNGIYLNYSSNDTILNNNVTGNYYAGIMLDSSFDSTISNNNAVGNLVGIWLNSSTNNAVSSNSASQNGHGIFLTYSSSYNTISGNNASGNIRGIYVLFSSSDNIVSDNDASGNRGWGIVIHGCSGNTVLNNNVSENSNGIYLALSSGNKVSGNLVSGNMVPDRFAYGIEWRNSAGISVESSYNNVIWGNNVSGNGGGVWLYSSWPNDTSDNAIYHNNFINNYQQAALIISGPNSWDNGYPSGGNYWSDYRDTDLYRGPYQNVTGSDGIGDTPYVVDNNNTDRYPLMQPWASPSDTPNYNLTITATAGGTVSPSPGTYAYSYGTEANVTALPDTGYYLDHWELYSINFGRSNPITITMDADHSLKAVFTTRPPTDIQITFDQTGVGTDFNGAVVTIDGASYTASSLPVSFWWEPNSIHNYSYASPIRLDDAKQYIYQTTTVEYFIPGSYTIGIGTVQNGSIPASANGPRIIVGNYGTQYHLTIQTNPPALSSPTGEGWYDANALAAISTPQEVSSMSNASRYYFSDWTTSNMTEMQDSTSSSTNVLMDAAKTVIANYVAVHDAAVTNITANCTWVYQRFSVSVNVTVANDGDFEENVAVALYYNDTASETVDTKNVTLTPGQNETLVFVWNTAGVPYCLNYTMTAVASIPVDNNPADNTLAGGTIKVRILGDINGEDKVNIGDVAIAAKAFGSHVGGFRWNPDADVNGDGRIDIQDIALIAKNFGKHHA